MQTFFKGSYLRYIFRLTLAFLGRFRFLILAGVGLGVGFFFLLKFLLPVFSGGEHLRIGVSGRHTSGDLPQSVLLKIGNGLTKLDSKGNVEPDLAESWETPDKGKTWIFTLKKGKFWHDKTEVLAAEINYQFSDVTIEYPNSSTVVFKLQSPYSAFPVIVSRPVFKKGLLGTGDWEVKSISLGGSYVERIKLQKVTDKKQRITYKFFPTEERLKLAFQLGEIDILESVLDLKPFETWEKVKVNAVTTEGEYVVIFFNTKDKLLAEKSIRQALSYAINKDEFSGRRAISPIPSDSWAHNSQVKPYNYDPDKAKDTLDTYKKQSSQEVILTLSTSQVLLPQAEIIAKNWKAVGVDVNVQVTATIPQEFQAFLAIFDPPEDPDQYSLWHSTQTSTNLTKYEDPRIDKLLEDGRTQIDSETRRRIYLDFQRFLVEDSPAIFLYYPTTYSISR